MRTAMQAAIPPQMNPSVVERLPFGVDIGADEVVVGRRPCIRIVR